MTVHHHTSADTAAYARQKPSSRPCCDPCPECGGLQCLCRPRFYAGQLLTEKDLNQLEQYIVEKNRLHNRHLHGWGVVCGLEVSCHPCRNLLNVATGYALSPCGDDIIVCSHASVDVCKLINACRRVDDKYADCDPPTSDDCADGEEPWILAICYRENAKRGMTPLRAPPGDASKCQCGGSGDCGCGGGGKKRASGSHGEAHAEGNGGCGCGPSRGKSRATPTHCEPTVICEEYDFRVYKKPAPPDDEEDDRFKGYGPMIERIGACFQRIGAVVDGLDITSPSRQDLFDWCCSTKRLRAFMLEHPAQQCNLLEELDRLVCPNVAEFPGDDAKYEAVIRERVASMTNIAAQYLQFCMCQALMPACGGTLPDNCVPLAEVTVRRRDCRMIKVCNWGPRKFVTTFPNLAYWLSPFRFLEHLHEVLEGICCGDVSLLMNYFLRFGALVSNVGFVPASAGGAAAAAQPASAFARAWGDVKRPITPHGAVLSFLNAAAADGGPVVDPEELNKDPARMLLLRGFVRPVLNRTLPPEITSLFKALAQPASYRGRAGIPNATAAMADVDALRSELHDLQNTVRLQASMIEKLQANP